MRRGKLVIVIAAVVTAAIIAVLAIKNNDSTNNQSTTTPQSSQTPSNQDQTQNEGNSENSSTTNAVSIENMAFSPASITVKKGTTVTWTNNDSVTHNVKATDGKNGPNSDDLANGQSYSFTFNETGTFSYNCSIHPQMTGTVTVTE